MYDLHCHLLPGIDDGPGSLDEALALARLAVSDGITHAVVTPHVHCGRYDNEKVGIEQAVQVFSRHLEEAGIGLSLAAGAEVRIDPMILPMLQAGRLPFIGRYGDQELLLLELPHSHIPPGSEKLVDWMLARGVRPLIAHPERNKDVIRKLDKIRPFVEMGCLLQVTAGAAAGMFGEQVHQRALEMLERGWVSILATDAHDPRYRVPALSAGRRVAAALLGEDEAERLVRDRPREWVADRFGPARAA